MALTLVKPGLLSLVVDGGRPDRRELGLPVGGAADRAAWRLGSALMGNDANAAALEVTLAGPTLEATAPVAGVVFGADFELGLNGEPWPCGLTFQLRPGDRLAIGAARAGVRAYLCVRGGIGAALKLGSRGGFAPLAAGATLDCEASVVRPRRRLAEPWAEAEPHVLRLLPGSHLTPPLRHLLAELPFRATEEGSRQGLRLKGPSALIGPELELASAPVAPGTVQLPAGGQPIILGVDAQTIGGYPRLAHVIQADLDKQAQLRPGQEIRFRWADLAEAEAAWRAREARLQMLEAWVRASIK